MAQVTYNLKRGSITVGNVLLNPANNTAELPEEVALRLERDFPEAVTVECAAAPDEPEQEHENAESNGIDYAAELSVCALKKDFEAMAEKYGVDISKCKNNAERKAAIEAALA